MNKYEEALKVVDELAQQALDGFRYLKRHYNDLKELVDEKTELESRKDKLVVGSEWECVANCLVAKGNNWCDYIKKGDKIIVFQIIDDLFIFVDDEKYRFIPYQQFLLCFKPIEREKEE